MRTVDLPITLMTNPTQAVLTLDALVDTCARFDPSDADQRLIVRTMVVPMLARRLKWLELLLRACPHSRATRAMFEQVERALACASLRLEGPRLPSAGGATRRKRHRHKHSGTNC